jgi:hypothetical protein
LVVFPWRSSHASYWLSPSPTLAALTTGRKFKGCHVGYADDPWSSHGVDFFVDKEATVSTHQRLPSWTSWMLLMPRTKGRASPSRKPS